VINGGALDYSAAVATSSSPAGLTRRARGLRAGCSISASLSFDEMAMDGDVMKMRELPDGLVIPAGETVNLKPGGYHVMFMDITGPLAEGETIKVRLTFEIAGEVDIYMPVGAPNAKMGGMQMHGMPKASE
jgi:copper(I)-binding protein